MFKSQILAFLIFYLNSAEVLDDLIKHLADHLQVLRHQRVRDAKVVYLSFITGDSIFWKRLGIGQRI